MLDDETLEIMLGPGTMPGTEVTQELEVTKVIAFGASALGLPPHLKDDPILTMPEPHPTTPSLFEHAFHDRPVYYPPRPTKRPKAAPIRARDHVLAALTGGVLLLGISTYVLVQSGWNSELPVSEQQRLHPSPTMSIPDESVVRPRAPESPVTSETPGPSHIPGNIGRRPQVPVSPSSAPVVAPTTPETATSASTPPQEPTGTPTIVDPPTASHPTPTPTRSTALPSPSPTCRLLCVLESP